jgi:hypothetical protein
MGQDGPIVEQARRPDFGILAVGIGLPASSFVVGLHAHARLGGCRRMAR